MKNNNRKYEIVYEAICNWFDDICDSVTVSEILLDVVSEFKKTERNEYYDKFTINELMTQYLLRIKKLSGELDSDKYNHAWDMMFSHNEISSEIRFMKAKNTKAKNMHRAYVEESVEYLSNNNLLVRFDLDKWNKIPNEDRKCVEIDTVNLTEFLDLLDDIMTYILTNKLLGDLLGGKCPFIFKKETIASVFKAMGIDDVGIGFRTFATIYGNKKSKFRVSKKGK